MSTFQNCYDLDLKSKVVINGETLETASDPSPISQGGHLILF